MVEMMKTWIEKVNHRNDLIPSWREREIHVAFQSKNNLFTFLITPAGICPDVQRTDDGTLCIHVEDSVMEDLLAGRERLTAMDDSLIRIHGSFSDVLYLESLMFLAK
ncbi:hypothetical protein [Halobacillus sp. KGW1]|uniref:hypothetical protein n=2 Tax=Bacillales TaxID=1385 RepID=UPI0004298330|nr:hypothetical protein [Halobacillus sp. KGW1]